MGFLFGGDFMDNKMFIMWVVWVLVLAIIGFKFKKKENISWVVVLGVVLVMMVVYFIFYSMGGFILDYDKVD